LLAVEALSGFIGSFFDSVASGETEIYNEFSLQHELGIFLRARLQGHSVRFERNVSSFFRGNASFTKREIDITVFSKEKQELHWAIELKYPRNGQHPEQMFSFCKDVAFAEELREAGFARAAVIVVVEDPLFYRGPGNGIYGYFRAGQLLHGTIRKLTGTKDSEVSIQGKYRIEWRSIKGPLKYMVVEVGNDNSG
jgi:hypothetical protein